MTKDKCANCGHVIETGETIAMWHDRAICAACYILLVPYSDNPFQQEKPRTFHVFGCGRKKRIPCSERIMAMNAVDAIIQAWEKRPFLVERVEVPKPKSNFDPLRAVAMYHLMLPYASERVLARIVYMKPGEVQTTRVVETHGFDLDRRIPRLARCYQVEPPIPNGTHWRHFRLDRIQSIEEAGEEFAPREVEPGVHEC